MSSSAVSTVKADHDQAHTVIVHVNEKAVEVPAPKPTGLEIKQAAVNAHLPVQLDFVLSEERHNGDTRIVGDADTVTVSKESRFLLVPPDDNS